MAKDLPYLPSYKNVPALFDKIEKAKVPENFTYKFLTDTIGLKGSGDRALISLLKRLGFLDNAGKPTPEYNLLKNPTTAKAAIAAAIRNAYAPLYEANEKAHELTTDELKGLIAQVTGAEEGMIRNITYTFNALIKEGDFTASPISSGNTKNKDESEAAAAAAAAAAAKAESEKGKTGTSFNPAFRFNIELHLPSNGTEETYLAIFNALRKTLA